jgi:hypothetical protein
MATRFDISDWLIHFTARGSPDEAFSRLTNIIRESRIIGSSRFIRGGYRCVCFTEAPLAAFAAQFLRRFPFSRYSPFGLMFEKRWVYERGGRPAIYEPDREFELLPEELRWRHVRYEPCGEEAIDFTWEREWRVRCDELPFTPVEAAIVVPNNEWAVALRRAHDNDQDMLVEQYAQVIDSTVAELFRDAFSWHVIPLE